MTREEDTLRRVLTAEASTVDIEARALTEIRQKIANRRPWRWRPIVGLVVATSAAAVLVGALVSVPSHRTPRPPADSAGPTASAPPQANLPVYYVGRSDLLYREFHPLPAGDGSPAARARAAVTAMFGRPYDPDYKSAWPADMTVRATSVDGDVVTVDLAGDATPSWIAVQELVWTATAASGTTQLRVRHDGRSGDPPGDVLRRELAVDTLAPVWLIDPQQGAQVRTTFDVYVAGIADDATVRLRVRDPSGRTVHEQSVTLDRGAPDQGQARLRLTLPAGSYTVEATVGDTTDDHAITVR